MKKTWLMPTLLTIVTTPMISVVGCANPDTPPPTPEEETEFIIAKGKMSTPTLGSFQLDWTNGHSLTFANDWKFKTNIGTVDSITATGGDTRPQTISVTFSSEMTEADITDGTLTFTYNDLTTKEDNISVTIENICITKYIYEPPYDEEVTLTYTPETDFDWECLAGPRGFIPAKTYKVVANFSQWVNVRQSVFIFFITANQIAAHAPQTLSVFDIIDNNGISLTETSYEKILEKENTYALSPDTDWIWFNYDVKQTSIINFYVTVNKDIDEIYQFAIYDQDWFDP